MGENIASGWWGWSKLKEGFQSAAQSTKLTLQTAADITKEYLDDIQSNINNYAQTQEGQETNQKAPWTLPPEYKDKEPFVKKQILLLSEEKWNFLTPPREDQLEGWKWELDIESAKCCLNHDKKLEQMRFLLVPYKVKEEIFWKNYFARIHIIKSTILDPSIKFSHSPNPNPNIQSKRSTPTQTPTPTIPNNNNNNDSKNNNNKEKVEGNKLIVHEEQIQPTRVVDIGSEEVAVVGGEATPQLSNEINENKEAQITNDSNIVDDIINSDNNNNNKGEESTLSPVDDKVDATKSTTQGTSFDDDLAKELKDMEDEIELDIDDIDVGDIDISEFNDNYIEELLGN